MTEFGPPPDSTQEMKQLTNVDTMVLADGQVVYTRLALEFNGRGALEMLRHLQRDWGDDARFWVIDALRITRFTPKAPFNFSKVLKWMKEKKPDGMFFIAEGLNRMAGRTASLSSLARLTVMESRAEVEEALAKHDIIVSLSSGQA